MVKNMNKLASNIPNKIKQPSLCCVYCGKSYIKRINLDKHLVICELLQKTKTKTRNTETKASRSVCTQKGRN